MTVEEHVQPTARAVPDDGAPGAGGTVLAAATAPAAAGTAVAEPAASGTALPLVDVTAYASTGVARYPVAPGYRVNVRTGPGTQYAVVRLLPYGVSVPVYCQKPGQTITGPYGTSNIWDCIAGGEFVSDAYVRTGSDGYIAPRCD
ncbi:SH3 domain-containing protein [uncultured Streptomyces sp.]|uniref:SH3 domain-containing protein n=1 Tax=uncultured Streptomyces sp. TaxID=174707 RepID=UPI00260DD703|nr:SH3 domain-containing protein [uncultured Streptomyces sp.]